MPALFIASFAATTPKSTADKDAKTPPKDPIGVLAADAITAVFITFYPPIKYNIYMYII
jgi:hypothetical protein